MFFKGVLITNPLIFSRWQKLKWVKKFIGSCDCEIQGHRWLQLWVKLWRLLSFISLFEFWLSVWLSLSVPRSKGSPSVTRALAPSLLDSFTLYCPPIDCSLCVAGNMASKSHTFIFSFFQKPQQRELFLSQHQYLISRKTLIGLISHVHSMILQYYTIIDTSLELHELKKDFSGKWWLLFAEEELENVLSRFWKVVVTWTILTV